MDHPKRSNSAGVITRERRASSTSLTPPLRAAPRSPGGVCLKVVALGAACPKTHVRLQASAELYEHRPVRWSGRERTRRSPSATGPRAHQQEDLHCRRAAHGRTHAPHRLESVEQRRYVMVGVAALASPARPGLSNEAWREDAAPKDEGLFLSGSLSISLHVNSKGFRKSDELPVRFFCSPSLAPLTLLQTPQVLSKFILRKIMRHGWVPELKVRCSGFIFVASQSSTTDQLAEGGYPRFTLLDDPLMIFVILNGVKEVLAKEKQVVRVPVPARVYGDIHGQFLDLLQFFRIFGSPDPALGDLEHRNYCFLGDFVDRGFFSLEVCLLLFSLKITHPTRVFLVRGNHESRPMSLQFGFQEELQAKLGDEEGKIMWCVRSTGGRLSCTDAPSAGRRSTTSSTTFP